MTYQEKVRFRVFCMPCCHQMLCWVNPRLPNYCPECGKQVYAQLQLGDKTLTDATAWLKVVE